MSARKLEKYFWITLLHILVFCKISNAQINYPRYEIDSLGEKVIVMTIEQAQSLDNNSDMLILVQKLNIQLKNSDSICVKVINDKDLVIATQKIQVSGLKESLNNKDNQIKALQGEIKDHELIEDVLQKEVDNRGDVIIEKSKQIKKMKLKMIFGGGVGAVIIGGLLFIILL
jgi:uncharacterized protein (DUF3084 family)